MYAIFCEAVISLRCDTQPLCVQQPMRMVFLPHPTCNVQNQTNRRLRRLAVLILTGLAQLFPESVWTVMKPAMHHAEARRNGRIQGDTSFKMVPLFLWQSSKINFLILTELIVFSDLSCDLRGGGGRGLW